MDYAEFFKTATKRTPYAYQQALADRAWPETLVVPTGFGKTAAVILAWLWKLRVHDPATPRRLVYCLPMRTLVEQTESVSREWIEAVRKDINLGEIVVDVLMGGRERGRRTPEWIMQPQRPALLIGTQDLLVSAALMRGYGVSRYRWPVDFALLNNDAFWVFDEVQLTGATIATSAQLEAFRRTFGAARPSRTLWMSATLDPSWLQTVDFTPTGTWRANDLGPADLNQARDRWEARKSLAQLIVPSEDIAKKAAAYAQAVALETVARHRPGKNTIVFLNTVPRAQAVFNALGAAGTGAERILVHSRFRPKERREQVARLKALVPDEGRIIVATQALEAGVDITSAVMITEIAPWSSLVQRFGRVNRAGEENDAGAEVWWISLPESVAAPYEAAQLADAREKLADLVACGPANLAHIKPSPPERGQVIRQRDLFDLFDTDSDLAGFDIDISVYVREANDTDVRIFWREVRAGEKPEADADDPVRDELCPAPVARARDLVKRANGRAWRWDALGKTWTPVGPTDLYPGLVIWVDSTVGGYDSVLGFDVAEKERVESLQGSGQPSPSYRDDPDSESPALVGLKKHTEHVIAHARELAEGLDLTEDERAILLETAASHDWGKAHGAFVAKAQPYENGPPPFIAKWPRTYKPTEEQKKSLRSHFRHELASALGYLAVHGWSTESSLAAYLIAAHHGKVRMRLRALPKEAAPPDARPFARGVYQDDLLPSVQLGGVNMPDMTLDLDIMSLGDGRSGPSWSARSQALLAEHGPFKLAWLETLLRIADWRASEDEGRLTQDDL